MAENTRLFPIIFQKAKTSELSRKELNLLIEKSFQISISFLKAKFKNKIHFINDDITLEDIAMNAIVPLFIKNSNGQLGISSSVTKWRESLDTESDCIYFLSRIIWRRVDQTIINILKERDPIFEKILKTLNACINSTELIKIRHFGTVMVLENRQSLISRQVIDETDFNLLPEVIFSYKQAKLFESIFDHIKNQTDYYPAIPLNLLVKRVKRFYCSDNTVQYNFGENNFDEFSLDEIVEESLLDVKEKLEVYYVSKNKLCPDESENIYAAFNTISKDFLNGGMQDSLYYYLKDFENSLTREIFYSKYHHIMNYLLTRFKNNITEKISE